MLRCKYRYYVTLQPVSLGGHRGGGGGGTALTGGGVAPWPPLRTALALTDLLRGEHPEIFAGIGERYRKSGFWRTKCLISLKHVAER